jgi:hypothetical protein
MEEFQTASWSYAPTLLCAVRLLLLAHCKGNYQVGIEQKCREIDAHSARVLFASSCITHCHFACCVPPGSALPTLTC